VGVALADGSIDPTNKYAWGTNIGWINFAPTDGGVTVYSDHLEGYAWGENIGWIRLRGTAQDSTLYGVNNDGVGNLSGYAWSENAGWINFAPTDGGVWVDPITGDFSGYAWGENVGWIHFQNGSPAYKVTTGWHGDLTLTYTHDITAVITAHYPGAASSGGLTIANTTFLHEAGDGILFGHNNAAFAGGVTDNLPSGVGKRWARIWQLDVNDDTTTPGGNVALTFDISDAGGTGGSFGDPGDYFLLKRDTGSAGNFITVTVGSPSVSGDQLTFTVAVSELGLGSELTLGAAEIDSPTAVEMQGLAAFSGVSSVALVGVWVLGGLLAVGVMTVAVRRKR
jgi:hypothetical protein